MAEEILERHLSVGACEPVNIDSIARSATRETLADATADYPPDKSLFLDAQMQIYHLMKLDSFPRFLKSKVYKVSLLLPPIKYVG